jgi:hypothetical protein
MGSRPDGGWIAGYTAPRPDAAVGVWSVRDVAQSQRAGLWFTADPLFSSVTLLLRGRGTNGSTTITDDSSSARSLSATGSAVISTTRAKWGSSSIFVPNGGSITLGTSPPNLIGTGNFTIEAWLWLSATASLGQTDGNYLALSSGSAIAVFRAPSAANANAGVNIPSRWVHVCMMRSSTVGYLFLDGISSAVVSVGSGNNTWTTSAFALSCSGAAGIYAQDIRVTSSARYSTAGFTPPLGGLPTR